MVDDEPEFPRLVVDILGASHTIDVVPSVPLALATLDNVAYDVVLTDLHMPPGPDGIELIRQMRARELDVPILMLTGHATIETAVDAMREGAFDYLGKSASPDELSTAITRALAHGRMAREVRRLRGEVAEARGVADQPIAGSPRMQAVMALTARIAPSDASVLILGESGTGKELLARRIHRQSARRDGPFVAFDCSALAPSLVESELFGHEKGAFTGAQRARRGLFREAQGGTLFLDEIGDVAPEVQNKLLRVVQEREVKPVGGDIFVKVDVRILSATNKNLTALVADGRFREDLYYRLAVVPIELPPLRERLADLPALVTHVLGRRRSAAVRATSVSPEAMTRLAQYGWPGNIRELENVIERAAILCDGHTIEVRDLPPLAIAAPSSSSSPVQNLGTFDSAPSLPLRERVSHVVRQVERQALSDALRLEEGSATRAARRLGISRASFYAKAKELGIAL